MSNDPSTPSATATPKEVRVVNIFNMEGFGGAKIVPVVLESDYRQLELELAGVTQARDTWQRQYEERDLEYLELAARSSTRDSGIEEVAKIIDRKWQDMTNEYCHGDAGPDGYTWTNKEAEWQVILLGELAEEIRALQSSLATVPTTAAPESLRGEERARYIHEHDCPKAWAFFNKHGLGSKLCPSCLLCGQQRFDRDDPQTGWAITHMELPDIYICKPCVSAARSTQTTLGQDDLVALSDLVDYAAAYCPMSPKGREEHGRALTTGRALLNRLSVRSAIATTGEKSG